MVLYCSASWLLFANNKPSCTPFWTAQKTYEKNMSNFPLNDTPSYKIPLSPTTKFWHGDTVFYQLNDLTGSGFGDSLIDEQNADPLHNPKANPPRTFYLSGRKNSRTYPAPLVIDLGGLYKLTNEFFYNKSGTAGLFILFGSPGKWNADTLFYKPTSGWSDVGKAIYTRYLKIQYNVNRGGYQKITEMVLYGYLSGKDSLSRIPPTIKYHKPHFTMGNFMGVNIWGGITYKAKDDIGGIFREYLLQNYLDTVTTQHNVDSIKFVFSKFSSRGGASRKYHFPDSSTIFQWRSPGTLQADLAHYHSLDKILFFSLSMFPDYLKKTQYAYAIDPVAHPHRDSVNAHQYDRLSRMAWTLSALFGSKKHSKDSIQSNFPNPGNSGMNIMKYLETGNEMNGTWYKPNAYYSPEMFEAYSSAIYDGDANTMGNRMGIKNADPAMQVVMAGTAGYHPERLKALSFFSYYKRRDHKLPLDVINFHAYPGYKLHHSPEQSNPQIQFAAMISTSREVCPGCEIWLTEWGYARNHQSINAVVEVPGKDSAQVQADWVARYWLLLTFSGIDKATYYQIRNEPHNRGYDTTLTTAYGSMGLTYQTFMHKGWTDYLISAFPVYYYVHTIYNTMHNYIPADTLMNGKDSLYIYKYKNATNDSVCYAIWSGTKTGKITDRYSIQISNKKTPARIIYLKDKKLLGDTVNVNADQYGNIPLIISETPQFLFTIEGKDGGTLHKK